MKFKVLFGEQYVPLVEELVEKALSGKLSCTAGIVLRMVRYTYTYPSR